MKRGVRRKEGEDFSKTKIEQVIKLLNQEKPITKKAACEMLNITYNTTRLNKIIDEYIEQQEYEKKRKKELKNKPLTKEDYSFIISSYLESGNISEIADITFRSPQIIKRALSEYNIPLRNSKNTYHNPITLDIEAMSDEYAKEDLVYSSRYDQAAIISKKIKEDAVGSIYRIWLTKDCQYALQPSYELGNLRKLQSDLGVKINTRKMWEIDAEGNNPLIADINQALINAKKRKKDES
jgi:hypothetical protein